MSEVVVSSSSGFTVIVPDISSGVHPLPVVVTLYVYVATDVMFAVGVPLMVNATGSNVNPTGSPVAVAPVAPPDKLKAIGSIDSPSQCVWSKAPPAVSCVITPSGLTVSVPVAVSGHDPPVLVRE